MGSLSIILLGLGNSSFCHTLITVYHQDGSGNAYACMLQNVNKLLILLLDNETSVHFKQSCNGILAHDIHTNHQLVSSCYGNIVITY